MKSYKVNIDYDPTNWADEATELGRLLRLLAAKIENSGEAKCDLSDSVTGAKTQART